MNIAVFIDLENAGNLDNIDKIMDHLLISGNVLVRRAYGNIKTQAAIGVLERLKHYSFITVHVNSGKNGKNASDIHLSLDAFECVIEKPYISVVALATGDSDFSPLIYKCRERNISVWGFGMRANTADVLVNNVDKFHFIDDHEKPPTTSLVCSSDRDLVLTILEHLTITCGKEQITQTNIQNAIQRIIPDWRLPPTHKSMRSYLKTHLKNTGYAMDTHGAIVTTT